MRKQAWEVRKSGHAPGHGRPRRTASQPGSAQGSEPARTLFSGSVRQALPPHVSVCRRDVHPHDGGPPLLKVTGAHPSCVHGRTRAGEHACVPTHTTHTLTHTHVSCARVPSFAPVSSSLSHFLDCSLLLPRTLMERGVILQVLTRPAQSTRAPHLPGLWPLYGRRPCPGSSPSTPWPFLLPGPPHGPPHVHSLS